MSNLLQLLNHIQLPSSKRYSDAENESQAQRLFHGRGHAYKNLHHITVDWLPPVVLITLFAKEESPQIAALSDELMQQIPTCKSIQLQHRYLLKGPIDIIRGETFTQLEVQEGNLKFYISLGKARNTGLFLDMKNGRKWVQQNSKNKRVLNLFAYTCGFSVTAIAGGATSVLNVDMSSATLNVGRENHRLNNQSLENVRFEKLNIFKSFGRLKKRGPFDLLICDPPTLQKGSVDIERDYPKIMRRLNEFMAPNATLVLCLNAPELKSQFLIHHMKKLAPEYQYSEQIKAPSVFVDAQDKGLKVLVFKNSASNLVDEKQGT